jgi:hypothetical protein
MPVIAGRGGAAWPAAAKVKAATTTAKVNLERMAHLDNL